MEPDPANFQLLLLNTRRFGNVKQVQKGLWDKEAALVVHRRECENWTPEGIRLGCSWGVTVSETQNISEAQVLATSVPALLRDYELTGFDYAKIDIEGAERVVFATPPDWLQTTQLVSIEVHEHEGYDVSAASLVAASFPPSDFFWTAVSEYHLYIKLGLYQALVRRLEADTERARSTRQL